MHIVMIVYNTSHLSSLLSIVSKAPQFESSVVRSGGKERGFLRVPRDAVHIRLMSLRNKQCIKQFVIHFEIELGAITLTFFCSQMRSKFGWLGADAGFYI